MGSYFLLLLPDPIDLTFFSLIQGLCLMRLELSDLTNNLYLFSKLILKFSYFSPILVFPTPSTKCSVRASRMKDITNSEEIRKYPQYRMYLLIPKLNTCIIKTDSGFNELYSALRMIDFNAKKKTRANGPQVPALAKEQGQVPHTFQETSTGTGRYGTVWHYCQYRYMILYNIIYYRIFSGAKP